MHCTEVRIEIFTPIMYIEAIHGLTNWTEKRMKSGKSIFIKIHAPRINMATYKYSTKFKSACVQIHKFLNEVLLVKPRDFNESHAHVL